MSPQADQTFLHLAAWRARRRAAAVPAGLRHRLASGPGALDGFDLPLLASYQARVSDQVACCCFFTAPDLEQTALGTAEKTLDGSADLAVRLCREEPDSSLYALLQQALCGLLLTRLPGPGKPGSL